jgi:hypothetical protein
MEGFVLQVLALSRSAITIRHWFEIDLDNASMEHGARVEVRELALSPHRGSESAAQLLTVDRPLWRADLFDRLTDEAGSFSIAHYHPEFDGNEPSARVWDARLTVDPWGWLGEQVASLGAATGRPWPVPASDADEMRSLAGVVVAAARQVSPTECRSAAQCCLLTRDVRDTVRLMIATLRDPDLLDSAWVAPWLEA